MYGRFQTSSYDYNFQTHGEVRCQWVPVRTGSYRTLFQRTEIRISLLAISIPHIGIERGIPWLEINEFQIMETSALHRFPLAEIQLFPPAM